MARTLFLKEAVNVSYSYRYYGLPIRPITKLPSSMK